VPLALLLRPEAVGVAAFQRADLPANHTTTPPAVAADPHPGFLQLAWIDDTRSRYGGSLKLGAVWYKVSTGRGIRPGNRGVLDAALEHGLPHGTDAPGN